MKIFLESVLQVIKVYRNEATEREDEKQSTEREGRNQPLGGRGTFERDERPGGKGNAFRFEPRGENFN